MRNFLNFGYISIERLSALLFRIGVEVNNLPLGIIYGVIYFIIGILVWRLICEMIYIVLNYFKSNTKEES